MRRSSAAPGFKVFGCVSGCELHSRRIPAVSIGSTGAPMRKLRLPAGRRCSILSPRMTRASAHPLSRGELGSGLISRAFAISLLVHFVVIAGVELGHSAGFWKASVLPNIGQSKLIQEVLEEAAKRAEQRKAEQERRVPEAELVFMDVDPAQAAPEPPKDSKFYGVQNTLAANPEPQAKSDLPKIDGKQENVPKTMDTLRPDPLAMQPAPMPQPQPKAQAKAQPKAPEPKPQPVAPPVEEPKPQPEGETLLARAAPKPPPSPKPEPAAPRPRPRTLAEARAQKGIISGQKMRQEGGVRRHSIASSMDVKATPFGAYDQAFIEAVQARWFSLLDERDFVGNQAGRVVVEFHLNQNGRVTALRVADSQVNETLSWICQRAILDPAPYRPFPPDLRRMLDRDYRPVRFTFYYNQ